jgi:hypothetical protein
MHLTPAVPSRPPDAPATLRHTDPLCLRNHFSLPLLLAALLPAFVAARISTAGVITWDGPVTISGITDVLTNGTAAYAYDWANLNQAVNGVSFTGSSSISAGGANVTLSGFTIRNGTVFGSSSAPFSTLPAAYTNILCGADYVDSAAAVTATLNNLTAGHLYAVQVWVNDSRGGGTGTRTETLTSNGGNANTIAYDITAGAGGTGQFAIGIFAASGSTQTFTITGNASTQLNALQVRDVTGAWPGAPITWSGPAAIAGASDVATSGTLAYAYDWANNNQTVNGVAFAGTTGINSAGANLLLSGFAGSVSTNFYSALAPFGSLPAAYTNILTGAVYTNGPTPATVTLTNLTGGDQYLVQVWVSDPRAGPTGNRTETVTSSGGNTNTLEFNTTGATGGVGQFVTGTFTANGPIQPFTLNGNFSTQLNALQLRDVTTHPLPQSTWVHFGTNGLLAYYQDSVGNRIPDFSFAGYEGGGVALPVIPVAETIGPSGNDDTANIQNAINTVSALTPDTNGFRGAVLLEPGTYTIGGSLTITASGVVLRGSGDNTATGTVLVVTNLARNVITVGGSGSWSQVGPTYTISDNYVPLGATNFHITGSSVVWGTNVTVSADTDVFTDGTVLYAYNWSGTNATVNGITFTGVTNASTDGGSVSITGIGGYYAGYTSGSAPFSSLSAAYRSILVGGEYGGASTATVTLNGLTPGHAYAVQVWVGDPRGGSVATRTETVAGTNLATLAYSVPAATGGVGQYSIGVFTASTGTQTFTLTGNSSTQLNALLVSDVTSTGYQPVNPPTNAAPSGLAAGDYIIIQRPQTQPWIDALGMNLLNNPWPPGTGLEFERRVTAVNGGQITIDDPICNPIEQAWATGQVFQVTDSARIQQAGVENLCGFGQIADYPSNILTGYFLVYQNVKNAWGHDLLVSGWGNGIDLGNGSKWCTVQDCEYTNPATSSSDTNGAPAAWTTDSSGAQDLFQRCVSDGGYYWIMVTQAGTPGPDVFLDFTCTGNHYEGAPHQRWAAGALFDNINVAPDTTGDGYTTYLGISDAGNGGTGHGWTAGFSILYNCQAPQFQVEQPCLISNYYNWVIGGEGTPRQYPPGGGAVGTNGIYDTLGTILNPQSLYLEQLKERLGPAAVGNIGYPVFDLSAAPATQSTTPGGQAPFTVSVAATNGFDDTVTLGVTGLPAGAAAGFVGNPVAGTGSATLTVSCSGGVAPGSYPLVINAIDGNLTNTTPVTLTVNLSSVHITSVTSSPAGLVLSGSGGGFGAGYHVLGATNISTPLSNWTILGSGSFDNSGNFTFTNPVTPANPSQFFLLRSP